MALEREITGIAALGLDWKLFISQIVNFLLLLWLLKLFAYQPVLTMLDKRRQRISKSLELARHIEQRAQKLKDEEKAQWALARQKAEEIVAQAKQAGEKLKQQLIEETAWQRQQAHHQLQQEVASLKEESLLEAKKELTVLVNRVSSQVLKDIMTDELNEKITQETLKKV